MPPKKLAETVLLPANTLVPAMPKWSLIPVMLTFCTLAHAEVHFSKGFAVINGQPVYTLENIDDKTLLYCPGECQIQINGQTHSIPISAFGYLKDLKDLIPEQDKVGLLSGGARAEGDEIRHEQENKPKEPQQEEDGEETQLPPKEAPAMGEGATITAEKIKDMPPNFKVPYPKDKTLFLFRKKDGRVYIFPKKKCRPDSQDTCILTVTSNGQQSLKKEFQEDETPVASISYLQTFKGASIQWQYNDSKDEISGGFRLYPFDAQLMTEALSNENNVEILD
jgi:hypothetical protein